MRGEAVEGWTKEGRWSICIFTVWLCMYTRVTCCNLCLRTAGMIFSGLLLAPSQTRFQEMATRRENVECFCARGVGPLNVEYGHEVNVRGVTPSLAGDAHVHKLYLTGTCNICVRKGSQSDTGAAAAHTRAHQSASHSVLTRVSRGIKEALRAKQKHSTCFLKERKHKRRQRLFPPMIQSP